MEPLNNEHIGTDHFVHYREVVLFRGKNVLPLYRLVHWKVSFIQRCPLFRVSFIRGSTELSLRDTQVPSLENWGGVHCFMALLWSVVLSVEAGGPDSDRCRFATGEWRPTLAAWEGGQRCWPIVAPESPQL